MAKLSRSLTLAARSPMRPNAASHAPMRMVPSMQLIRGYADKVVQVPPMAESISEGTLKQFSKGVGDFVEQDEELATIETDKVTPAQRKSVRVADTHS